MSGIEGEYLYHENGSLPENKIMKHPNVRN